MYISAKFRADHLFLQNRDRKNIKKNSIFLFEIEKNGSVKVKRQRCWAGPVS
jgi:hypothetical protein